MALVAADVTKVKVSFMGPGLKMVTGVWTPSGTYTSGGEDLTRALLKSITGLSELRSIIFTPLVKASDGTTVNLAFDRNSSATSQGKIRAIAGGAAAHTHSFLAKGGTAAAGTDALNIKATIIGKEAATDATNTGGANGGVQTTTAGTTDAEIAAGTNLSTYSATFVAYGN